MLLDGIQRLHNRAVADMSRDYYIVYCWRVSYNAVCVLNVLSRFQPSSTGRGYLTLTRFSHNPRSQVISVLSPVHASIQLLHCAGLIVPSLAEVIGRVMWTIKQGDRWCSYSPHGGRRGDDFRSFGSMGCGGFDAV